MDINEIKIGMKIKVGYDLTTTKARFTTTPTMHKLKGKICEVMDVGMIRKSVHFANCVWDPRDLLPVEINKKIKKIEPITFDPTNLDLD